MNLSYKPVHVAALPDCRFNAEGVPLARQLFTRDNVAAVATQMGITCRLNMMTMDLEMECEGSDTGVRCQEYLLHSVVDELTRCGIARNETDTYRLLYSMGRALPYHPLEEWMLSRDWDGEDRFQALVDTVPTDSALWPVYLRKWLIQVVHAARGWADPPESLCNVLIFVGAGGVGKGRWLRSLLPGEFVLPDAPLHLNTGEAKDHQLAVLSRPVAELAEIDSTFGKSHTGALKSFLSRPTDTLRAPYARKAEVRRRGTVFFGSVNHMQFLIDETGTRRFWPVSTDRQLNWDHGIDMQQLWAQVCLWWEEGEDWMLGEEYDRLRAQDSQQYLSRGVEVEVIEQYFSTRDAELRRGMTVLEICEAAGLPRPSVAALSDIRAYLTEQYGKRRKIDGKRNAWEVPYKLAAVGTGDIVRLMSHDTV